MIQTFNYFRFSNILKSISLIFDQKALRGIGIIGFICLGILSGCSGYQCGTGSLYNREIKTVYVPMVQADSYRNGLGERLTEAVCKRITERTPYDLANVDEADSELIIRLVAENQTVSALNKYNDTRQKNFNWTVLVVWRDRRQTQIAELDATPIMINEGLTINAQEYLVAEMGQSTAVTQQNIIDKLADQIVDLMESPW
ncbi:MAG: LPS assembly lipoprotein LptE [Planctomycetia bacterium]|nr:LPS assembly lipoprotein LptE [Planctomycetia bacterium]